VTGQQGTEVIDVEIRVTGTVQGVGYRAAARRRATELGLEGAGENQPDGSVVLRMHGPREAIDAFVDWCGVGPRLAQVRDVSVRSI
jgi:acylphosphatase